MRDMQQVIKVNDRRLEQRLQEIARFGRTEDGGVTRIALTQEDKAAREQLVRWFEEAGCEVHVDPVGNIFAVVQGKNRSLPGVLTGSHSDSQPSGGMFDGVLGVIAGLEVVQSLKDNDIVLERDLIVVNWTNEEGTRFTPGCTGSGVWAGKLDLQEMYLLEDKNGKKFGEELEHIGFKGTAHYPALPLHAAFELHIEQGPILDREGIIIGVPEGIVCLRWFDIEIVGEPNHAGSTPMDARHDALYCFSVINQRIREIAVKSGAIVATVGEVGVTPNSRNVVPGHVHFTLDVRGWNEEFTDTACEEIEKTIDSVAAECGCFAKIDHTWKESPAVFDRRLVALIKDTAGDLQYSWREMVSGASHDMIFVNQVAPGAMIFVPSIGGKSHSVVENTLFPDCAAGADVLLNCVIRAGNE